VTDEQPADSDRAATPQTAAERTAADWANSEWIDSEERELTAGGKIARVAIALFLVSMAVMWAYILLPSSKRDHPDRLDETNFPEAAEPVCAEVMTEVDALPPAEESGTPQKRADVIDEANALLSGMVLQLRPLAPTDGDDAQRINEWLDDWQTYIGDRGELAAKLHEGEDARLTEAPKKGYQLTEVMDTFADINDMPSCGTPGDVV
jgi:hypothetical protein